MPAHNDRSQTEQQQRVDQCEPQADGPQPAGHPGGDALQVADGGHGLVPIGLPTPADEVRDTAPWSAGSAMEPLRAGYYCIAPNICTRSDEK